jgi:cell division protein FtsB
MRTEQRPTQPPIRSPIGTVPGTRQRRWVWVAAIVASAALAGGAVFAWQQAARESDVAAVTTERDAALARLDRLTDRVADLRAELSDLAAGRLEIRRELRRAQARLESMLGPALPDGRHFGRLVAVGASQEPPRLVIDIEQWFTGEEAAEAAIEDGVLPPGATAIENDFYIRNEDPRWRMLEVDPATTVSLTTYPYGDIDDPMVVSLTRFGELYHSTEDGLLRLFPYWITVRDGTVVQIEEQFIP